MSLGSVKEHFLQQAQLKQLEVYIFLHNGIKLDGHILQFDEEVIYLSGRDSCTSQRQIVYQHAISTVLLAMIPEGSVG